MADQQQPVAPAAWRWPKKIDTFPQLIVAVRSGFDIVLVPDQERGKSHYVLARDGQRGDRKLLRQDVAIAFISKGLMGHGMKMSDGAYLYKRTTRC